MPLYFPPQANPLAPPPPAAPEPPPVELGRCRYCESMTTRQVIVIVAGLEVAYVCPRSECMKDHEREVAP